MLRVQHRGTNGHLLQDGHNCSCILGNASYGAIQGLPSRGQQTHLKILLVSQQRIIKNLSLDANLPLA